MSISCEESVLVYCPKEGSLAVVYKGSNNYCSGELKITGNGMEGEKYGEPGVRRCGRAEMCIKDNVLRRRWKNNT